jgi:hypothetical protein
MVARYGLFVALLVCVAACKAEDPSAEPRKPLVDNSAFVDHVPTGWVLQDHRILDADIDGDSAKDAILTLIEDKHQQKGDIANPHMEERAVLVLLGDKTGKYRRSSFAKNAILCASCAGMMGSGDNKEPGEIRYANNVFTIGWISGSRDTVDVELSFSFNAKLKQFVLLSDRVEKRDRLAGESRITKRDFVAGTKTVSGTVFSGDTEKPLAPKVTKIDRLVIPIEAVKYYDYLTTCDIKKPGH